MTSDMPKGLVSADLDSGAPGEHWPLSEVFEDLPD